MVYFNYCRDNLPAKERNKEKDNLKENQDIK